MAPTSADNKYGDGDGDNENKSQSLSHGTSLRVCFGTKPSTETQLESDETDEMLLVWVSGEIICARSSRKRPTSRNVSAKPEKGRRARRPESRSRRVHGNVRLQHDHSNDKILCCLHHSQTTSRDDVHSRTSSAACGSQQRSLGACSRSTLCKSMFAGRRRTIRLVRVTARTCIQGLPFDCTPGRSERMASGATSKPDSTCCVVCAAHHTGATEACASSTHAHASVDSKEIEIGNGDVKTQKHTHPTKNTAGI